MKTIKGLKKEKEEKRKEEGVKRVPSNVGSLLSL